MSAPTAQDRAEFKGYCQGLKNFQVLGVIEKEREAAKYDKDRAVYAEIAEAEAERRGLN